MRNLELPTSNLKVEEEGTEVPMFVVNQCVAD